jgi:hypothetical protein
MSQPSKLEGFKKKRVEEIKDEVKEFHPLLQNLFKKMPSITRVEYTHGNTEMGADFVLSMTHPILNTERYIGVIVKVGKITQDTTGVEKQVKECAIPRYFEYGKKEIHIDEVWVVSNGTISNNAKTVIRNNAQLRSVEFIGESEIISLIDKHLPLFWSNLSVPVSEYISKIREKNLQFERSTSLLQIGDKDFYVEQDVYEVLDSKSSSENRFKSKPKKVNFIEQIKNNKISFIEGSMGTGKSRLLRKLISHFTSPEVFHDEKLLPVIIDYKDLIDKYEGNIEEIISDSVGEELKKEFGDNVTLLLLIDGVDEKKFSADEELETFIKTIVELDKIPNLKTVLTSRPLKTLENAKSLSGRFGRYEIRALTFSKVIEFVKNICKQLNLTQRIVEDLKKSRLFRDLPQSPISAILLAKLIDEHSKELPSNMTELYSKYTELTLGKWDIDKGIQSDKEYQTLNTFFMNLSEYMIQNELKQISIEEAKSRLTDYLKPRNLGLDVNSLLDRILNRCEIVATDHEKGVLFFKHRTFAEFLYAKKIIETQKLQIDERFFTSYWNNVFYFCVGILKDCPEVLEAITNYPVVSETQRIKKMANLPNFYLAGFASPYKVISDGNEKLVIDAAKYYIEVTSNKQTSIFTQFPPIICLYFMNYLIQEGLSYDFFIEGLETAALSVASGANSDDEKAYALFFLNVAFIKLKGDSDFSFLLKEYKHQLPLDLLCVLDIESKNLDLLKKSKILQKQNKKFKGFLRGNTAAKHKLQSLLRKPIGVAKPE